MFLKFYLNGSAVSGLDSDNRCGTELIYYSQSDFKMAAYLQEVSIYSFLQAISFCSMYVSQIAATTRNTFSFIKPQNRERLHCSSQKIIEAIEK